MTRAEKIRAARRRYRQFTGHAPAFGDIGIADLTKDGEVVFIVGEVDGIMYTTVRDGRTERYIHEFGPTKKSGDPKSPRPLLAISHDGKQAFILGGGMRFTARGFVG